MAVKWFIGKTPERVFAVYKAEFAGKILKSEQQCLIPQGTDWESTNQVSKWYFVGNETVYPSTQSEVAQYLPKSVIA